MENDKMFGVSSQIDEKYVGFLEKLPHGSGIDLAWNMRETRKNYYFTNSYHLMDEHGGYRDWQNFSIVIPKSDFENGDYSTNWRLEFNWGVSYWTKRNDLRSYLEDIFSSDLRDLSPIGSEQLKINFDNKWNTPEQIAARKAKFQNN